MRPDSLVPCPIGRAMTTSMTDGAASACPGILTKTIGSKIILTKMVDGSRAFLHSQVYL